MKVTNGDVWQAREPLQTLLKEPWPVKTAYRLAKLVRKINGRLTVIEEVRAKLINQYGTTNDQGHTEVKPTDSTWEAFATAFNELMAEEEEMDIEKIILPDVEGVSVPVATFLALEPFVDME